MYNLYLHIANNRLQCKQLTCGGALFTLFNCGITKPVDELWSHHNYIMYVLDGRKIWHTAYGSYHLQAGSCVFVRKGAAIVEQFFDAQFCFFLFFIPDEFICDVLKSKSKPIHRPVKKFDPIMPIDNSNTVNAYFQGMLPYFDAAHEPDQSLVELKFRELILTIADNPANGALLSYFHSLLQEPQSISMQRVMEENFCFNLQLEDYARLCARSLSAFKRDFQRIYHVSPGRWLLEKRLDHALHLLTNMSKSVSEAAYESGFESASHFSRTFRQRFGATPVSIRRQTA